MLDDRVSEEHVNPRGCARFSHAIAISNVRTCELSICTVAHSKDSHSGTWAEIEVGASDQPADTEQQNRGQLSISWLKDFHSGVPSVTETASHLREHRVMKSDLHVLSQLKQELAFLDSGGYRVGTGWAPLRFFEDSPICKRSDGKPCDSSCPLWDFVLKEWREEPAPCRHIVLNDAGETLNSLYVTGTNQEIESAVRSWLVSVIGKLESELVDELNAEAA